MKPVSPIYVRFVLFAALSLGCVPLFAQVSSLLAPWLDADIGAVFAPGKSSVSGGLITVTGAGADIWGTADAFHYLYQPWSGDGEIIARVISVENVDPWSKVGVMFRETPTPGAANVLVMLTPGAGTGFQCRTNAGGATEYALSSWGTPPFWLKLARLGNIFQAYESADGTNWALSGWASVPMAQSAYVGIAVSSHSPGVLCSASFDKVNISPAVDVPAAPTGLVATGLGPDRIQLVWRDNSSDEESFEIRATAADTTTDPTTWFPTTTVAANVTAYLFNWSLNSNTRYTFRVRALQEHGASPWSDPAAASTFKLPPPWQNADVGQVGVAGDAQFLWFDSGASYQLDGAGGGIGGHADAFQYLYVPWQGDGAIFLHMWGIESSNRLAEAGLMIRHSLLPDSPNVTLLVMAGGATALQSRVASGGDTASQAGPALNTAWLKLTRTNDTFTAYAAQFGWPDDRTQWQWVGSVSIKMQDPVFLGLAVSSSQPGVLCKAYIYDFGIHGAPNSAVVPSFSGLARLGNGACRLTLLGEPSRVYTIEAAADRMSWGPIASETSPSGIGSMTDTNATKYPLRFYRARISR